MTDPLHPTHTHAHPDADHGMSLGFTLTAGGGVQPAASTPPTASGAAAGAPLAGVVVPGEIPGRLCPAVADRGDGGDCAAEAEPVETPGADVMLPEESSGGGPPADGGTADVGGPHETESVPGLPAWSARAPAQAPPELRRAVLAERRRRLAEQAAQWRSGGASWRSIATALGVSLGTVVRLTRAWQQGGGGALEDRRVGRSGRRRVLPPLPESARHRLLELYLRTNRARNAGNQRLAARVWATQCPEVPDEWRNLVLEATERGRRLPMPVRRLLQEITPAHFSAFRAPSRVPINQVCGRGVFLRDKLERRRVIESDDGTLNFVACIPWSCGGDPCSDKYGVRIGRWQWLPLMEAGWSHQVVGYALVCRPRGSYRAEDVRQLLHGLVTARGLPEAFRFERGVWESDTIREAIEACGVELTTVYSPNGKPFIEGFFNKAWSYLSVLADGQVGRYRGEMERENRLVEACRAGRKDPRRHFPMLDQALAALDECVAMHNSDTIRSRYGSWVPNVRAAELDAARPWRQPDPGRLYLFAPVSRVWTVQKGGVGGMVPLLEDLALPYWFAHEELWRWNGHRVRVYFDPTEECPTATIVSLDGHGGVPPGQVICRAPAIDPLPGQGRPSPSGPAGDEARRPAWRRAALSALRRETRFFDNRGGLVSARSEQRDGRGAAAARTRGAGGAPADALPRDGVRSATARPRAGLDAVDLSELLPERSPARPTGFLVSMDELNEL